jgi:ABC-2 type transport system ATP-binding protein
VTQASITETPSGPSQSATAAAEFMNVSKTYTSGVFRRKQVQAVREVSLRIEMGEVFGLVGPNRAGKTTLIKMLLSLCRPSSGQVYRLGQPLSVRATLAQVGYVHENHAFPRYLSARELLHYNGALTFIPHDELVVRVPQLLKRCGLDDRSEEPIGRFSKGMLQRLGLAQALLNSPRLLVLDEPTEGLDLEGRQLLRDVVREVRKQGGAVVLVSHLANEIEQLCDRIAVIVNSRLVHVGPVAALLKGSQDFSTDVSNTLSPNSTLERALKELYLRPTP